MNDTTASAQRLVSSVLNEAFSGPTAAILKKYHILDDSGEIRMVKLEGETAVGPILNPDVIARFLALDTSNNKRVFDWMMYASGGGETHIRESRRAIELAKNWVIENRMKGKDKEERDIKPMTREEAEADWQQNSYPEYYLHYFFADQDLASDKQYPVFGWFRNWPGRHNVYEKICTGIAKWQALAKDKKFLQTYNRSNPKEPFQTTLWAPDGTPLYKDVDALLEYVGTVKATLARRQAEKNVKTVGKNAEGGYHTGSDEVLYHDDVLTMYVPLTAAASLKHGYNDWCVANRSRWDDYFKSRRKDDFMWAKYTQKGPFAFIHFRQPPQGDPHLQSIAAHVQLDNQPGTPGRIEWWDRHNQKALTDREIMTRAARAFPGGEKSVAAAIAELEEYLKTFKLHELERFPALEMMARALVANLLS